VVLSTNFEEFQKQLADEISGIYSEAVKDHAFNPRNMGDLPDADGFGKITGPCGDTMQIWLKIKDSRIINAAFSTDGCGTTRACGSMVTEMIKEKEISQAIKVTQEKILKTLGGLPEEDQHCALLAANTLKAAIQNYYADKKEPWKKAYRNR
jgi:nitrogen fixation NifU-like protein